jgi:hypothetical protein
LYSFLFPQLVACNGIVDGDRNIAFELRVPLSIFGIVGGLSRIARCDNGVEASRIKVWD